MMGASAGLAPMEGVTELPARLWFGLTSAPAFAWTPFLRITDTFPQRVPRAYAPEGTVLKQLVPYQIIPQVMSPVIEHFYAALDLLLRDFPFVDLNCGCPSPKCLRGGAGSMLLCEPYGLRSFVGRALDRFGPGRISVKMRTGFASAAEFPEILSALADLPLHHLCIHGRTREQKYGGRSDWQLIAEAKKMVVSPVIGSGDILCREDYQKRRDLGIETVIIGRGALRNPFIFEALRQGRDIAIPAQVLVYSIAVYALLQFVYAEDEEALIELALAGHFMAALPLNGEAWQEAFYRLAEGAGFSCRELEEIPWNGTSLGRTKMLWNYLRMNLPEAFSERKILQVKSLGDFFRVLRTMVAPR